MNVLVRLKNRKYFDAGYVAVCSLLLATGLVLAKIFPSFNARPILLGFYIPLYLISGYATIFYAIRGLLRKDPFNENFLMTIAGVGALIMGEYPEAAAVMIFYRWGCFFEKLAEKRGETSIKKLMSLRPDVIAIETNGQKREIPLADARVDDVCIFAAGDRAGIDALVITGEAVIDKSAITGESTPVKVSAGMEILAGSVISDGFVRAKVLRVASESSLERILALTKSASERKTRTEKFISRFARVYTPTMMALCLVVAVLPPLLGAPWQVWIMRALSLLVISCPCALVISVPLSYFGGLGLAGRRGVFFKGSAYLDAFTRVKRIVFDKTGTLTTGKFQVIGVVPEIDQNELEILGLAAVAGLYSKHPLSLSIKEEAERRGISAHEPSVSNFEEIKGRGVKCLYKGKPLLSGSIRWLREEGVSAKIGTNEDSVVLIAYDGLFLGTILLGDAIRSTSRETIAALKAMGITPYMFTGDAKEPAGRVADQLGIDRYVAEMAPEEKLINLEKIMAEGGGVTVFVGDGINDTPSLARADVGMAMGSGIDAALDVADAAILNNEPSAIAAAYRVAKRTKRIVIANIIFALGVKGIFVVLGIAGVASLWGAVFADTGVLVLAILNALRLVSNKKN